QNVRPVLAYGFHDLVTRAAVGQDLQVVGQFKDTVESFEDDGMVIGKHQTRGHGTPPKFGWRLNPISSLECRGTPAKVSLLLTRDLSAAGAHGCVKAYGCVFGDAPAGLHPPSLDL